MSHFHILNITIYFKKYNLKNQISWYEWKILLISDFAY